MPTPIGVGNVAFREVSQQRSVNYDGTDSLVVRLRGESSLLPAAEALWPRLARHVSYPNMYLVSKNASDRGPVSDLELTFTGYIDSDTPNSGIVSISDDISLQSVQLTSDEEENVTFNYRAQATTWVWMSRSANMPENPRFGVPIPTKIPTGFLYNPSPPNYSGSVTSAYRIGSRLQTFKRDNVVPGLWRVTESWLMSIEPV